ncbi:nickel pincer cofactor biosynthesis protein LarC [Micromonospora rifamycinica]|uniref:nickel pincer cofactor biosynthesis protein LarC n=1 Tax=Micromonospora rifamycinica TaxID=291594 RepID=UPI0033E2CEA0
MTGGPPERAGRRAGEPGPVPVLWIDASNGAAGDMLLAALLDAGADPDVVRAGLARLHVEPIVVEPRPVRRHGFRATLVEVRVSESTTHRRLTDVVEVIRSAGLDESVTAFACAVFDRLAAAEARVHGTGIDQVHFHEVGALDAIADVVGCALALHELGVLAAAVRVVSPVAVGSGQVHAAHGVLPVPAPAVLELLTRAGAPLRAHPASMELCTPTGAALLSTLATGWGPTPPCVPRTVGVGAGQADPAGHANLLRVLIGAASSPPDWRTDTLHQVECTIDDLDPRIWPDLLEQLREAGAADAWCSPALMRKGRPGQVLSVLVDTDRLDLVCRLVFEQTTTLGVRVGEVHRRALRRDVVTVAVDGSPVRVKRGHLGGRVVNSQPEYDDVLAVARRTGRPLADVLTEVHRLLAAQP